MRERSRANEDDRNSESLARQVAVNTLWGSAGRIVGGIFALATSAFLFRALGPDGAGTYAMVLAFFYLFNALADGGFYNILLRDIARPQQDAARLVATAFTLRAIALGIAMTLGVLLFTAIPQYDGLFRLVPFAVVFYAALSFAQLLMAIFQHHLAVYQATRAEITARLGQFVATAALFQLHIRDIALYFLVLVLSAVFQLGLLLRSARAFVRIRVETTTQEAIRMLRESLPVAIGLVFTLIYFRLDAVLLSLLKTPYDVGIYSLSYKALEQLIFFPAMFLGVLTPILSRAFAQNREAFQELFLKTSSILAMGALPLLAGGWFLAEPVVIMLGGSAFAVAADPLRPLLFAVVFIFFGTLLGASVIIAGKQRRAIPIYALGMVVNLAGNFLLIPKFSYMGSAWATVFTEMVIDIGLLMVLASQNIRFAVPKFWRIVAATTVMTAPLALWAQLLNEAVGVWSLAVFLIVCPAIYVGALTLLRVVTRADLRALRR